MKTGETLKSDNKPYKIFIDARLMFYAGIGRYQREFILNVLKNTANNEKYKINAKNEINLKFYLLGDKNKINQFIYLNDLPNDQFIVINNTSKKYSFKEQFSIFFILLRYRKEIDLFFFPHYNISIFYIPKNSIVTVHDLTFYRFSNYTWKFKTAVGKFVLKRVLKKTKKAIAVSDYVKNDIINMFGNIGGLNLQNKIKVIYSGYSLFFSSHADKNITYAIKEINGTESTKDTKDTKDAEYKDKSYIKKFNFDNKIPNRLKQNISCPYILYLGNRKKHKNILNLIKAFKLIKDSSQNTNNNQLDIKNKADNHHNNNNNDSRKNTSIGSSYTSYGNFQDLKLVLIGSRFEKFDFIDEFIKKENIGDIIQLSNISDGEAKIYYENAKAFTFISISEGFGFAPLEAAVCGAPLILANAGALPEIFKDAALFVDPYNIEDIADSIKKVLTDENLRNDLNRKSLALANKYSYKKMASEMLDYFIRD
ncbi:MAG: glycosyltransferase family 4 protein [bacterium]